MVFPTRLDETVAAVVPKVWRAMLKRSPSKPETPPAVDRESLAALGAELRGARAARGEDLADVAARLRIRVDYLEALERGDPGALPGRPYAVGFLRAYADALELDAGALVARLKAAAAPAPVPELTRHEPRPEGRRPARGPIAAAALLAMALFAGYRMLGGGGAELGPAPVAELPAAAADEPAADEPAAAPAVPTATVPPAAVPPLAAPPAAAAPPATTTAADPPPAPALPASAPPPPPVAADVTSAVAAEAGSAEAGSSAAPVPIAVLDVDAAPPADRSESAADARVILVARESSWVQVRSAAHDWVRTRSMNAGERFVLPDRTDLALWTGNAGGVELLVDGRSVGLAGAAGAVVKDLPLAPDSLKQRPGGGAGGR